MDKRTSLLDELMAGGDDYKVSPDLGGAVFSPVDESNDALHRFQTIAQRVQANDGLGYNVVHRQTLRGGDERDSAIHRIVINIPRR